MTLQQLRYIVTIADKGSITEASRALFLSQPSLSEAVREVEKETGITIFRRNRSGAVPTREGLDFIGSARQIVQQMELLEERYIPSRAPRERFAVSTQHYTFTANAFAEMVQQCGFDRYEFILNETTTHQIIEDVRNRTSDLGILYLTDTNRHVLSSIFREQNLVFTELFAAKPHVFLCRNHPLANRPLLHLEDLAPYPRLSFVQGAWSSPNFAEEMFSSLPSEKEIRVSDRAAIVNLMIGVNGYTISSGIFPRYLQGDRIVAVPLECKGQMSIGCLLPEGKRLSGLSAVFVEKLRAYKP